jgi:hypothetical protein
MNHAKDIFEKTIHLKSQEKVISIIQNNYFDGEEVPFYKIVQFLKRSKIEIWLEVLDQLNKKDISLSTSNSLSISNSFGFLNKKTIDFMIKKNFLDQSYIYKLLFSIRKQGNFENHEILYKAYKKDGYLDPNNEKHTIILNECVKENNISYLIQLYYIDKFDCSEYIDKIERKIKNDSELYQYLSTWDGVNQIESRDKNGLNVIDRLVKLEKFKLITRPIAEILFDSNHFEYPFHKINESHYNMAKQLSPESKKIILKQEPTFRELFSIVEAEKEKKALNEILTTTEKNKITIKRI